MPAALTVRESGANLVVERLLMLADRRTATFTSNYDLTGRPSVDGDESRFTRTVLQRQETRLVFTSTNESRVTWKQEWRLDFETLVVTDTRWGPTAELKFQKIKVGEDR